MADDTERETTATKELDKLTAAFHRAERSLDRARDALHEGIVRHLREQNAKPSVVSRHTPYDRNYVRGLAKAAGVPPVREPRARAADKGE
ncbi:hypothetical protein [Streptomyces lonarensis]|uniref:Uncharacterized protein n=1 Tax=Streptomyces lonarensis TaxID=700599 RepID=A0A7X6HXK1_9ACTN|nr:hypothetical protein [Streptomyces lonarensis]NJQ04259.1 hypothetical protein [Streptomyces lonarensis]